MDEERAGFEILLVSEFPPPGAGLPVQARAVSRALAQAGCHVHEIPCNPPAASRLGDLPVLRSLRRFAFVFASLLGAPRCDLVHVMTGSGLGFYLFTLPAILVGRLRGMPVLLNYHGGAAERFLQRHFWLKPLFRLRGVRVVVPSGFLATYFRRFVPDVAVVPNLLDLSRFTCRFPQGRIRRILSVRNLTPVYDIGTTIRGFARAWKEFPELELTIAGDGPERERLEALVRSLGLADAVRFLGNVDNGRIPELMAEADVLVNAARVDNMPVSLIEAQASGACVVTSRIGGIPWMVEEGVSALFFEPGDASGLADALLRLCRAPELARRLAEAGYAAGCEYDVRRVVPRWLGCYSELLESNAKSGAGEPSDSQR